MYQKFRGESGRCTKYARAAVRLGFHDAAGWSKSTEYRSGGADGSIILGNELIRAEHDGLQDIGITIKKWYDKYHRDYGVSMADLIQMGANVATVTCPLGPRVRSFVGRQDSSTAAPSELDAGPYTTLEKLIELSGTKPYLRTGWWPWLVLTPHLSSTSLISRKTARRRIAHPGSGMFCSMARPRATRTGPRYEAPE